MLESKKEKGREKNREKDFYFYQKLTKNITKDPLNLIRDQ